MSFKNIHSSVHDHMFSHVIYLLFMQSPLALSVSIVLLACFRGLGVYVFFFFLNVCVFMCECACMCARVCISMFFSFVCVLRSLYGDFSAWLPGVMAPFICATIILWILYQSQTQFTLLSYHTITSLDVNYTIVFLLLKIIIMGTSI